MDDYENLYSSISNEYDRFVDEYKKLNLSITYGRIDHRTDAEKKILKEMLGSKEAELIAILGRRRVGKTQ